MAAQMEVALAHANVLTSESIVEVFACGHATLRKDLQTSAQQAEPGSHEIVYGPGPGFPEKHVSIYDVHTIADDAAKKCVSPLLIYTAAPCDLVQCQEAEAQGSFDALKQVVPFRHAEHAQVDELENTLDITTQQYMDAHRSIRNVHQIVLRTIKYCYLDSVAGYITLEVDELTGSVTARMFTDRVDVFVQGEVRTYTSRMLDCVQNGSTRLAYEVNSIFAQSLLKLYIAKTQNFVDLACKILTVENEIGNRGLLGNASLAEFIGIDVADLNAIDGFYDADDDNIKREQVAMAILAPELASLDRVTVPKVAIDVTLANAEAQAKFALNYWLEHKIVRRMANLIIDTGIANAPHQLEQRFNGARNPVAFIDDRRVSMDLPFPPSNDLRSQSTWEGEWQLMQNANTPLDYDYDYDVPGSTLVGLPGTYPMSGRSLQTPPAFLRSPSPSERDPRDYIGRGGFLLEEGPETFTGWQPDLDNLFNPARPALRAALPEVSPTNVAFVDVVDYEMEMTDSDDHSEAFALDDYERSGSSDSEYTDVTNSYCYDSSNGMNEVANGANAWDFDYNGH